jgi:hypothetical protein
VRVPLNERSLALAARIRFAPCAINGSRSFKRRVPPLTYTDGVVTIRRQRAADLEADLEARDDEQIDWLWLPGERESWQAMTPEQAARCAWSCGSSRQSHDPGDFSVAVTEKSPRSRKRAATAIRAAAGE